MNWFTSWFTKSSVKAVSAAKSLVVATRAMLGGAFAGGWASDHREEAKHFTGFNYVAIHAISSQVAGATVSAFVDSEHTDKRISRRKSLRAKFGTLTKYKSTYGQDDKETDPLPINHPLVKLLQHPNPHETGSTFRYKQAQQIRLTGTCLVWNVPSMTGVTCQRYVLPTSQVTPVMPTVDMPMGGWRVSAYSSRYIPLDDQGFVEGSPTWSNVLGQVIDARQVQVIRLPHPWWFDDGQSPISAGAQWIDTESGVNSARVGQLRNGADASLIWSLPPDVSPDQDEIDRATAKINQKYAGPENAGKVILAMHGTEVTPVTSTPKDMCYSEAFQDVKNSVLSLHQTPPVAVGLQEAGAYAAYYASMLAWRHSAIQPLCDMLAESDTKHIATQFGEGITIEIESPLIDDKDQEEKEFSNNVTAGICTIDELRAKRGLPPLPNGEGAKLCGGKPAPAPSNDGQDLSKPVQQQQQTNEFPSTPFGKSATLKAAMDAADEVDLEWLASQLKSFLIDREPTRITAMKSHWITIHPHGDDGKGVHVEISDSGEITKGPAGLSGKHISELSADHKRAAKLIPHAHEFLVQQHEAWETAKQNARRITGLTAGDVARHENNYRDHSTVDGFDSSARDAAMQNPELGFDPDAHDTPAKIWELIREGKRKKPTANSPEVRELAHEWAKGSKRTKEPAFAHDDDWDSFGGKSYNPSEPRDADGKWTGGGVHPDIRLGRDADSTPTPHEINLALQKVSGTANGKWSVTGFPTMHETKWEAVNQAIHSVRHQNSVAAGRFGDYPMYTGNFRDVADEHQIASQFSSKPEVTVRNGNATLTSVIDKINSKNEPEGGWTDEHNVPAEFMNYRSAPPSKPVNGKPKKTKV